MIDLSVEGLKKTVLIITLIQARLLPMFLLLPFFNRNFVPRIGALGVAAAVGLIVVPVIPQSLVTGWDVSLIFLVFKEAFIGLVLGYVCAIPFWVTEGVGFIVDNQRGASMAATINPLTGSDSSPTGMLLGMAFITYFFSVGGMTLLFEIVYDSYRLWPVERFWPMIDLQSGTMLFQLLNRLMTLVLILVSPVLLLMFLIEIGLALVSRFAPQLQVFFLAMPIKSAVGLFVLIVFASTLFDFGGQMLSDLKYWPVRLDDIFGGKAMR